MLYSSTSRDTIFIDKFGDRETFTIHLSIVGGAHALHGCIESYVEQPKEVPIRLVEP